MRYSDIVLRGIAIYSQLKILHWQTKNNMHHLLHLDLYKLFDLKNDLFMLVLMGKLGKPLKLGTGSFVVQNINLFDVSLYLELCTKFYLYVASLFKDDKSLCDIIYDIINIFRRKLYLFLQLFKLSLMVKKKLLSLSTVDDEFITMVATKIKRKLKLDWSIEIAWATVMDDLNLYGLRSDIVKDRIDIQRRLKRYHGIDVPDKVVKLDPRKIIKRYNL